MSGKHAAAYDEYAEWLLDRFSYVPKHRAARPPLVIVDSEDPEQVERLIAAYLRDYDGAHTVPRPDEVTSMRAALREVAYLAPSRPAAAETAERAGRGTGL